MNETDSAEFIPDPPCFCKRIVSGGQTGVDRGALDFAIKHRYPHGGWAPAGRKAEDGCIPRKYQLTELPAAGYIKRTRRNVEDSDGTLIVTLGDLEGGTLATRKFAERQAKPCLTVQLDAVETAEAARNILDWLRTHTIETLNVAGPRESKCPGIQQKTMALLEAVDALLQESPEARHRKQVLDQILAGRASGSAKSADTVFDRLEAKHSAHPKGPDS